MTATVAVPWWGILLAVALWCACGAVCWCWGRSTRGARHEHNRHGHEHRCLIGEDESSAMERRFVGVLPQAVVIVDAHAVPYYASPQARQWHVIDDDWRCVPDVVDMVAQVAADGRIREREMSFAASHGERALAHTEGRGVQAGAVLPSRSVHVRVRVGSLGGDRFAVLLADVSEQRRFEAMRRDFVTNVSHELKTPAGAIALLAETLVDAADDADAVRYFAGRITKESERLTELVHHLIDLQRAQDSRAMLQTSRVSALSVVREAMGANAAQAEAKHIEVALSWQGKLFPLEQLESASEADERAAGDITEDASVRRAEAPMVCADREALVSAVKNLVENAIRYSPERTAVTVEVLCADDMVKIRVIDQGIGIPEQSLGRIFERFYRVDPARSRQTGGSGLGLSIAKHCVQECGGTISVWSRPSEGSTFTIALPLASDCADISAGNGAGNDTAADGDVNNGGNGNGEDDDNGYAVEGGACAVTDPERASMMEEENWS